MASGTPGRLDLEEVLRLQRELYAAYSDDAFQQQLEDVESRHGKAYKQYSAEHTKLFLTVQDRILPKYGFAEGQRGVVQMLDDVKRFNGNATFEQNRLELNRLIGLAPEAEEPRDAPPVGATPTAAARAVAPPAAMPNGAEPAPPAITELLRWQPRERQSLLSDAVQGAAASRPAQQVDAPRGAGAAAARAPAPGPGPRAANSGAVCTSSTGAGRTEPGVRPRAAAQNGAGEDIGAWLKSLEDGSLAQYEPFMRRLVSKTSEIKVSYPLLQDFFEAVPVNDPRDRQAFARAIRTLP